MFDQAFECTCDVCCPAETEWAVAPLSQIKAVQARGGGTSGARPRCPRCAALLGRMEVVVDTVGYAHFVQPCGGCMALWVVV